MRIKRHVRKLSGYALMVPDYFQDRQPEKWEQCCYLPTFGGFRNINRFGTLILSK
ncbi:MAG: hypothetical protein IJW23_13245 [Lentisphaeria bacterium]|nr:hypothetical protein [Lentisphaeria bacterium]